MRMDMRMSMKRKFLAVLALAAASLIMLTACTSSENKKSEETKNQSGSPEASGTVSGNDSAAGEESNTQTVEGNTVSDGSGSGDVSGDVQAPVQGDLAEEEPSGDVIPDEDAEAAEEVQDAEDDAVAAADDIWTGAYAGEEESVTLSLNDDGSLYFSFAQSGISGMAEVSGYQAVYHGDDHYVVVFNINHDILDVSVSNEEDYDASDSPLIGTYVKAE